jgi:hypothetical protein
MSTAGVISGTPTNADVGVYTVVVTATDDATTSAAVSDTFSLTVVNTDDATVGSSATTTLCTLTNTGGTGTQTCSVTLPAGETLDVTVTTAATWASDLSGTITDPSGTVINPESSGSWTTSTTYTYQYTTAGSYTLTFTDSYADGGSETMVASYTSTTLVLITGGVYDGSTLTADTQYLTDDDGMGTFAYQWADQDGDLTGATSSTYVIPNCESTAVCSVMGDTFTVTATHTDADNAVQVMPTTDATAAVSLNPTGDLDGDGTINSLDTDDDGDGWIDTSDEFPTDSDEWLYSEGDGIGNNEVTFDDG